MLALHVVKSRNLALVHWLLVLHLTQTQIAKLFLAVKLDQALHPLLLWLLGTLLQVEEVLFRVVVCALCQMSQFLVLHASCHQQHFTREEVSLELEWPWEDLALFTRRHCFNFIIGVVSLFCSSRLHVFLVVLDFPCCFDLAWLLLDNVSNLVSSKAHSFSYIAFCFRL